MWETISRLDLVERLGEIGCPVLVIVGEFDPSSPPEAAKLVVDRLPDARMHVIVGASHLSTLEQPDVIEQHLRVFFAEQAGRIVPGS